MTDDRHSDSRDLDSRHSEISLDPAFQAGIERLHHLTVLTRWGVILGLWSTVGALSLWAIRQHLAVLADYFTWAGLRYVLIFNRFSAIGLIICIALTLSTLLWQSRNILWGRSAEDQERLHQKLLQINQQGQSHPLWHWVYGKDADKRT
jgi:hypothetical protein